MTESPNDTSGERVVFPASTVGVPGYCPACGDSTLFRAAGGYITCSRIDCPRPTAASEILEDPETEHVVTFSEYDFTIRHPLRERLDDALMTCQLHARLASAAGPPVQPGRYRAREMPGTVDGYSWQAIA